MSNVTGVVSHQHLSFSGTLRRSDGKVLLRRGATLLWEHSFTGSPRDAESLPAAVRRSAEHELGIRAMSVEPLLPLLGHAPRLEGAPAVALPSYVVNCDEEPKVSGNVELRWSDPLDLGAAARRSPQEFSALFVTHATLLPFFGGTPDRSNTLTLLQERAAG